MTVIDYTPAMQLRGWTGPVSPEVAQAIREGRIVVIYCEKDRMDYLKGSCLKGTMTVEFQ